MSTTMRDRLLSRLHRVFARTPEAVLALRLRASGGLRWRIADDVLTVSRPATADLVVPLAGATVGQVRTTLAAAGCAIAYSDTSLDRLGALALLPGDGDQDASNGDHLYVYTSILWGWVDTVGRVLDRAKADIAEALRQLTVPTAEGEWLDLWAGYFGLQRRADESDSALAARTVWEPRRPRNNPVAIRSNIRRIVGAEVEVREPWREMMRASVSRLDGQDRLPNGTEYCYHYAQLTSRDHLDWDAAMREAEADRPAGTLYLPPVTLPPPYHVEADVSARAVAFSCTDFGGGWLLEFRGPVISHNWRLSDPNSVSRPSPSFRIVEPTPWVAMDRLRAYEPEGYGWYGAWDTRTWRDQGLPDPVIGVAVLNYVPAPNVALVLPAYDGTGSVTVVNYVPAPGVAMDWLQAYEPSRYGWIGAWDNRTWSDQGYPPPVVGVRVVTA